MSAYGNYQNAYQRASVNTVDQHKLVVMLYDGAIKNINIGIEQLKLGNLEKAHNGFVKSKNIISELMISLNVEKGGQLANNLKSLYNYMFSQLVDANITKKPEPALVVLDLLKGLREAWVAISKKKPDEPMMGESMMGDPNKSINVKS